MSANTKSRQFNVRLPTPLYEKLQSEAEERYTSISHVMREAVIDFFAKKKPSKK